MNLDNEKDHPVDAIQPATHETTSPTPVATTVQEAATAPPQKKVTPLEIFTVVVILMLNLLNYADTFSVPSILPQIEKAFKVQSTIELGMLQTAYILVYMLFAPLFGYLGDRYTRKYLLSIGVLIWSVVSIGSAFIPEDMFWVFLTLRALVGVGEAANATISPTCIADLFPIGKARTIVILLYQSCMLLGTGVGYMLASQIVALMDDWRYAFYLFAPLVFLCAITLLFVKEPVRGESEGVQNVKVTSYSADVKYLAKNPTYVHITFGYTALVFVVGGVSFWMPYFATDIYEISGMNVDNVGFVFGLIAALGGFVGAIGGTVLSSVTKRCVGDKSDALVCAIGCLICGPILFCAIFISPFSVGLMWALAFISVSLLSLNLVLNQEILLYILVPTRRATGGAVQLMLSHLLGDAWSPFIIDALIDAMSAGYLAEANRKELIPNEKLVFAQNALYLNVFVIIISAMFYFFASLYVAEDKANQFADAKRMEMDSQASMAAPTVLINDAVSEKEIPQLGSTTTMLTNPSLENLAMA